MSKFRQRGFNRPERLPTTQFLLLEQPEMFKRKRGTQFEFTKKSTRPQQKFKSGKKRTSKRSSLAMKAILDAVEHKYRDYAYTIAAISQVTGSDNLMVDPATNGIGPIVEGSDAQEREGRSITVDQLHYEGFVRFNGAEAVTDPPDGRLVTILIFQDTQTNGAQCISQDVVTNPNVTSTLSACFIRNPNGWTRFNSLARIQIACPPQPITQIGANDFSYGSITIPFSKVIKLNPPVKIRYNATDTATIDSIVDNSFHMLAALGGGTTTTQTASIAYNARMRFYG